MIPNIPLDTNQLEIPKFYRQIVDNLKIRSMHHEAWHTHKRDSSVCWICDLLEISTIVISELERFTSKSALDIDEQFLESEVNSEGSRNVNGDSENRPGDI